MEWQDILDIWRSEFENFIQKVDSINEEWALVPFNMDLLSEEEKKIIGEDYPLDWGEVDTCYDFRREIQQKIRN